MKAIRGHQFGGPESLTYEEAPEPAPRRWCMNGNWAEGCRTQPPSPTDRVRVWPAKIGHPIQALVHGSSAWLW